uniref:Uncharacterized protein n=1 Tax=Anguilla anguilla TaxID=7936 RepID=A0A0E9XD16_ANGAN
MSFTNSGHTYKSHPDHNRKND